MYLKILTKKNKINSQIFQPQWIWPTKNYFNNLNYLIDTSINIYLTNKLYVRYDNKLHVAFVVISMTTEDLDNRKIGITNHLFYFCYPVTPYHLELDLILKTRIFIRHCLPKYTLWIRNVRFLRTNSQQTRNQDLDFLPNFSTILCLNSLGCDWSIVNTIEHSDHVWCNSLESCWQTFSLKYCF